MTMKLLLAMSVPFFPAHGGANTSNRLLFESLARRGHEVRVVTPMLGVPPLFTEEELLAQLRALGVAVATSADAHVFSMGGLELHAVRAPQHLRRYLEAAITQFRPDYAVVSTEDPSQNLLDAALKTGSRVVYMARTTSFLPFGPQAYFPSEQRARLLEQVSAIVTVSEFVAQYVRQWSGLAATALPISLFGTGPFPHYDNFDGGFVTMLNPCAVKGIDIFAGLARALPQLRFAAVPTWGTTGPDRELLAMLPNVTVLAAVSDIDIIYAQTRVVLVPSLWAEAKSRTIVEAMLRGLPVLASAAGGNAEAIDAVIPVRVIERFTEQLDDNLLPVPVVPPQDLGPWVQALTSLLASREAYARRSEQVRDFAHRYIARLDGSPLEDFLLRLQAGEGQAVAPGRLAWPAAPVTAAPKAGAGAAGRLKDLSPQQQALLLQRIRQKAAQTPAQEGIPRVARDQPLPLSFSQQRLWFMAQLEPDSAFYNIPLALKISGALDATLLARVITEVVRRHESLRTTFSLAGEQPVQVIHPPRAMELPCQDLGALDEAAVWAEAERRVLQASQQPFDLSRDWPLRASLLRVRPQVHVLVFTMHHIVADGWGAGVLVHEVTALYGAFQQGVPSPLPELPIQYADYASWQRRWLTGARLDRQLQYWKTRLAGAPQLLELPVDLPRPAVQGYRGRRHRFQLGYELAALLRRFSAERGGTLYMTLLAVFNVLLARYSGQADLCVGTAVANRGRAEIEPLIGFFVNTVVMRSDLSGDPTFAELLQRTGEMAKEAYAHQDLPFEHVVEVLSPQRNLSHAPIVQVYLILEPPARRLQLPQLEIERFGGDNQTTQFDLTLQFNDDEVMSGELHYSSELFLPETIARMAGHLARLLRQAAAQPATRISRLALLGPQEQQALLAQFAGPTMPVPADATVHALVEQQARATPEAAALVLDDQVLSYRELDAHATALAHHLARQGVAAGSLVALCLDRNADLLVACLAVLKAGCAYVPLDPGYPRERLSYMLRDAAPAMLLTHAALRGRLDAAGTRVLVLDDARASLAAATVAGDAPVHLGPAGALAYVIYTSGSTGRPKGVQVTHRSVVNFLRSMARFPGLDAGDRLLAVTPISFDIAGLELFLPLCVGAAVVLATRDTALDAQLLLGALLRHRATAMQATPATWRMLVEMPGVQALRGLKALCGGDVLPPTLAWQLQQAGLAVFNLYGPTETTIWSSGCEVPPGTDRITLGAPIDNTRLYVLDRQFNPVPTGVAGELHIAGEGLARGYLGRPGLTAERFVPDPFAGRPGERMYRTGDLVRCTADGRIDFLGRLDHQVKLRGFRIELGEVEQVLMHHPAVRQAVVVARADAQGTQHLVAYVVAPAGGDAPAMDAMRAFLAAELPDHMVPGAFVRLDALPLTPNGKLDRAALPAPDFAAQAAARYVEPAGEREALVARTWADILGLGRVGALDSFFELGGHSLLAVRAVARLREALGADIPLRALFEAPTVRGFAAALDGLRPGEAATEPIARVPRDAPLPLSFAQQRLWLLARMDPASVAYNMPGAFRLSGPLHVAALQQTLREVVHRHESLRTRFAVQDGRPVQGPGPVPEPLAELTDLSHLALADALEQARQLAAAQAARPFDLEHDDPLRAQVLRLAGDDHIVLLTLHHIAADGWSFGVLMQELGRIYPALAAGQASPLPELPIQYADFAVWQRQWLAGERLDRQAGYWRSRLEGAPAGTDLPTDHPRPAVRTHAGRNLAFVLDAAGTDAIGRMARAQGATVYMVLLAAFSAALSRFAGLTDLCVGSPVAHRPRRELEGLIGFFANTLVMRCDLSGDPTLAELLARVREVALGAYAHEDLPFEHLVDLLRPERDPSRTPLFQVLLGAQNADGSAMQRALSLPGIGVQQVFADNHAAKFDLSLYYSEQADGLRLHFEYSTDLFTGDTIGHLATFLGGVLRCFAQAPQTRLSELELPAALRRVADGARARDRKRTLVLSGSFTLDPLQEPLAWWMRTLGVPAEVVLAPYNQVLQELLNPLSTLAGNACGVNLVVLRLEDWLRGGSPCDASQAAERLRGATHEFLEALARFAPRAAVPTLVCCCPGSQRLRADGRHAAALQAAEEAVVQRIGQISGVYCIPSRQLLRRFTLDAYDDERADEQAHIPYTREMFAALGTEIARGIDWLLRPPYKVVAVDCDNTLWSGVLGEVGVDGLVLDEGRRALQAALLALHDAGFLLCLASRNDEADVWQAFERRGDFPLRRHHFVASRIHWGPKSESLRALAAELLLGLDSFVFLDDNPIECAEVAAGCPQVLALTVPGETAQLLRFVEHVWAFDHLKVTPEARSRTAQYRQNQARELVRAAASSFEAFMAGLRLQVELVSAAPAELERLAELTQRTSQFNLSGIRRSAAELARLADDPALRVFAVRVQDRFGDYGTTGVVVVRLRGAVLELETFLLSCRVLGRGVEHEVLRQVAGLAQPPGCEWVEAALVATPRNTPMQRFLREALPPPQDGSATYRVSVGAALALRPSYGTTSQEPVDDASPAEGRTGAAPDRRQLAVYARIATELHALPSLLQAMAAGLAPRQRGAAGRVDPRNRSEQELARLCAQVLRLDAVGVTDDFFALGGNSLKGVDYVSRIHRQLGVPVTLAALFEHRTVERLAALLPSGVASALPPIEPMADAPGHGLSGAQARLWLHDRLHPGSTAYHIAGQFELPAGTGADTVARAVAALVRRHASLRTSFFEGPEGPLQRIHEQVAVDLPQWSAGSEAELAALAHAHACDPFALEHAPLFRTAFVRCSHDGRPRLLWCMHHIIADGTSLEILKREAGTLVAADVALPPLPIRYVDFAAHQQQPRDEAHQADTRYWMDRLAGALPTLNLPYDFPRSCQDHAQGASYRCVLPLPASRELQALARRSGTTLFVVLLAALHACLERLTGQRDLLVTSPVAGRNHPDTAGVVGCFINTVVLRQAVDPAAPFLALLAKVQDTVLGALAHQDHPFERLIEDLGITPEPGRFPVSPLHVNFLNYAEEGDGAGGTPGHRPLDLEMKFDLHLVLRESAAGLQVDCLYRTACFLPATVEAMAQEYLHALRRVVATPDRAVRELGLFDAQIRGHAGAALNAPVLQLRGAPPVIALPHENVLALFDAQVQTRDAACAMEQGERRLSYRELDRWSRRIAGALVRHGLARGEVVALLVQDPLAQVATLLGVMRAGGVFAALDPRQPVARNQAMLQAASAVWVVADEPARPPLQELAQAGMPCRRLLWLGPDADGAAVPGLVAHTPEPDGAPVVDRACLGHEPACIYFTSGSTGTPKAILGRTLGLAHFIQWEIAELGLDARTRASQLTAFTFDAVLRNLFTALGSGGVLCIPPADALAGAAELACWLQASRTTLLHCVPSVFRTLLDAPLEAATFPDLRAVLLAGEALQPRDVERWTTRHGTTASLINLYGATETTLVKFAYRVPAGEPPGSFIPIGRPMPGCQAIVLDDAMQPCPAGRVGEIFVRTPYRSLGYYGRPDLTDQAFVPNPFADAAADDLLYRTGDLGLVLEDGNFRFMGRRDSQIKLRGIRVELAEVELALAAVPGVRQAVVLASDGEGGAGDEGEAQLLAYVVADEVLTPPQIREALRRRLPEFMLPSSIVLVPRMPLTPNGKVDRQALRAQQCETAPPAAPRNATEQALVQLWMQVLKREEVGIHDDFFALGGHSLRAMVVVSRLRAQFAVDLPLRTLFEQPTIAQLAPRIDELRSAAAFAAGADGATAEAAPPPIPRLSRERHRITVPSLSPEPARDPQ